MLIETIFLSSYIRRLLLLILSLLALLSVRLVLVELPRFSSYQHGRRWWWLARKMILGELPKRGERLIHVMWLSL